MHIDLRTHKGMRIKSYLRLERGDGNKMRWCDVCWGKRKRGGRSVLQSSCITIDWPSVLLAQPLNGWIKLSFTQHSSILSSSQSSSLFSCCHLLLFIYLIFLPSVLPALLSLSFRFFHSCVFYSCIPLFVRPTYYVLFLLHFPPLNSSSRLSFCHCCSLLLSFSSPAFICHKYSNGILWKRFHI